MPLSSHALDLPQLKGYINDYADMMSPEAEATIENELRAFEQSDSTQIIILTIPSLEGEVMEEFSIKVAEAWKIGQKGKDNGLILIVAKQERKIRIEVGRGLEGRLTDLMSGRIIDNVLKPAFKKGEYDAGFIAGVRTLMDASRGEFKADKRRLITNKRDSFGTFLIIGVIILVILGKLSRILPVVGGAIGMPLLAGSAFGIHGIITMIFLAILGAVIGLIFSGFGSRGGGGFMRGGGGYFPAGGGSWSSSGGSWGDSGGGFSGGGGDFGGGGASGDW